MHLLLVISKLFGRIEKGANNFKLIHTLTHLWRSARAGLFRTGATPDGSKNENFCSGPVCRKEKLKFRPEPGLALPGREIKIFTRPRPGPARKRD